MTDENEPWQSGSGTRSGRPNRAALVAGAAVAVVILATIGAVGGWVLAGGNEEDPDPRAGLTPTSGTPTPTRRSTQPSAVRTTRPPTTTAPPIGYIVLPDLVGKDFEEARAELRKRGLGWQLTFGGAGSDRSVASTSPRGGTTVKRGTSVSLSVLGAPPQVTVRDFAGQVCREAASRLVDDGLYPDYPTGKNGRVQKQDPQPPTTLRWNDRVRLYCGTSIEPTLPPTP